MVVGGFDTRRKLFGIRSLIVHRSDLTLRFRQFTRSLVSHAYNYVSYIHDHDRDVHV